jgi:hypothetical protein
LAASGTYRGHVKVGEIPRSRLDELEVLLGGVPVDNTPGSSWNCQNWVLSALEYLKECGYVGAAVDENFITSGLAASERSLMQNF